MYTVIQYLFMCSKTGPIYKLKNLNLRNLRNFYLLSNNTNTKSIGKSKKIKKNIVGE